jgi:transcription-repair coupling factor (superfamily II helicase)
MNPLESFTSRLLPCGGRIYNLGGSSAALFLSSIGKKFIMVESLEDAALRLWKDVIFFRRIAGMEAGDVVFLPAPDGPKSSGERADAVLKLTGGLAGGLILSKESMNAPLWMPGELEKIALHLRAEAEVERESLNERLASLGYGSAPLVTERGQYRLRGWLLDIFPSSCDAPLRVEFFGDRIEKIKWFDVDTQRSVSEAGECLVMPAKEPPEGGGLLDILSGFKLFSSGPMDDAVELSPYSIKGEGIDAGVLHIAGTGILPGERKGIEGLPQAIGNLKKENKVIIVASSGGQAERLRDILRDGGLVTSVSAPDGLIGSPSGLSITTGELSSGLFIQGLLILTGEEIFGGRPQFRPIKKSKVANLLRSLDDLEAGDYVVHEDHGIGRFLMLLRQEVEGHECDLMAIEYKGGDRLYLPIQNIGRLQKYHGPEGAVPQMDALGSRRWQSKKERIRKKIKEMAGKLLKIYAEREVVKGFSFSADTEMHREFDSFFPYEETPDQLRSIAEIKEDMESEKPMDRLLSGDVGYGKTEVAARAAFKAVYDGRQVAVLVPTTLLCEQHMRTFRMRFSAFPVSVDFISRFKTRKEQAETARALGKGEVDIIIGTHVLLNASFHDLGLLIIDEEHRFGVAQKEKIKGLKKGVDVLALSATPIPRTLQMAISGIRSMSVIETPPEERLSVKTFVSEFDEKLIKQAVEKELERGGQVFFVHNRIENIKKYIDLLKRLLPGARCGLAHGRMHERDMEEVMLSFLNKKIDVLVSTAIVGSGLDIPSVNTIIVDMAHKMGLADLYQLRGRVGRSDVRAYAYFIIPDEKAISAEAKKRLHALKELSYMGAGFRLAMKDLEIRGAGNLLGAEQSGYINDLGFDMYIEMLEKAVSELKGIEVEEGVETTVNLRLNAFIPEDYISDMALRLSAYRRIALAGDIKDVEDIGLEMEDRFGAPPEEFLNLLRVMELKLMGQRLSVTQIRQADGKVRFTFADPSALYPERIVGAFNSPIKFLPDGFEMPLRGREGRMLYEDVRDALTALQGLLFLKKGEA